MGSARGILMAQLSEHDYTDVRIVDVEVPASIAQERAVRRWWEGRLRGISGMVTGWVGGSHPRRRSHGSTRTVR